MRFALFILAVFSAGPVFAENLPDPKLTPGNVWSSSREEICRPGYGLGGAMLAKLRYRVLLNYGLGGDERGGVCAGPGGCSIDHLIAVGLGGSDDIRNLWPIPNDGPWNAADKQALADELHTRVCAGTLSLAEAQAMVSGDWIAAYRTIFGKTTAAR